MPGAQPSATKKVLEWSRKMAVGGDESVCAEGWRMMFWRACCGIGLGDRDGAQGTGVGVVVPDSVCAEGRRVTVCEKPGGIGLGDGDQASVAGMGVGVGTGVGVGAAAGVEVGDDAVVRRAFSSSAAAATAARRRGSRGLARAKRAGVTGAAACLPSPLARVGAGEAEAFKAVEGVGAPVVDGASGTLGAGEADGAAAGEADGAVGLGEAWRFATRGGGVSACTLGPIECPPSM